MVENKSFFIVLGIIILIGAIYYIPKLDIFSVYQYNLQFPYSIYASSASTNQQPNQIVIDPNAILCESIACPEDIDPLVPASGNYRTFDYGIESSFYRSNNGGYIHDLSFDLSNRDAKISGGKTYITPYLNIHFQSNAKSDDSSQYPKLYYSINSPMSCSSTGCTGQLFYSQRAYNPLGAVSLDISNLIETPNINEIYIASYTQYSGKYSWFIIRIPTNLVIQVPCTEGELKQVANTYYICKNSAFVPVYLSTLTPAEQAALAAEIAALNATVQQKAALIASLTANITYQSNLINQLQLDTNQKAQMISALSSNITYQAQLISQMQLTSAQQLATIQALNLNIAQQAEMINSLQTNLNNKVYLISQLQVENANQARLISEMNLSFSNQAYIIQQLRGNISNDAEIIRNLNLNIQDQAELIQELNLQKEELAQLVNELQLSNQDTAELLNDLHLTIDDQIIIINQLNRSVQDEQQIINDLQLTIEQQNKIIADLQAGNIPSQSFDFGEIWDKYKILIIVAGVVFFIILFLGGKK